MNFVFYRTAFEVNDADGVRSGARADTRGARSRVRFYLCFTLNLTGDWTDGLFFYSQVTTQSRLRCLQHVSLLKSLSDDQRTTLVQLLQPRQYTEGEVVFNQGDAGDKFYIVETGNVAIHRRVYFDSRMGK